jgi:hypothetical protein
MNKLPDSSLAANGHSFYAYLEGVLTVLAPLTVLDYYAATLPSPADEALRRVISAFTAWPSLQRDRFIAALPAHKLPLFGIFGHRAATLAVRQSDPDWLHLGLIAFAIANYFQSEHSHNPDIAFAVFYHCARKLEMDPEQVFDAAAGYAGESFARRMRAFGRRNDVTLKLYGWREIKTPDGYRYTFET